MLRSSPLVLWACLLFTGCSDSDSRPPMAGGNGGGPYQPMGSSVAGSAGAGSVSRADYPDGPYGSDDPGVGERIENLTLYGFVQSDGGSLATDGRFGEVTLQDIREEGRDFLVLHVGAVWCGSCRAAAGDLAERAEEIVAAGGAVVELVIDGQSSGADPTKEELELWIQSTDLTVTTVGPGDDRTRDVFPNREHAYIVDLDTMEVVWHREGLYASPTVGEQLADAALSEYLR